MGQVEDMIRGKVLYDYAYSKYPNNQECVKAFLEGWAAACQFVIERNNEV